MAQKTQQQVKSKGPNLQALGLKSPMEAIDILGLLRIDGHPIIKDDNTLLDPQAKANTIVEYFHKNYNLKPSQLPYLASIIKQQLKSGQLSWRR